jgi:hypothetical protein
MLLAALVFLPGAARSETYVGIYLGGVQGANADVDHNWVRTTSAEAVRVRLPGHLDPAIVGGLKIGTWFVKQGFLGYDYPDWMKYLGFYLDFSFHRLDFSRQQGTAAIYTHPGGVFLANFNNNFFSEGTATTIAFMFAGRLGFFPDSEVPFGRLQPILAVGPAIFVATQDPKNILLNTNLGNYGYKPGTQSDVTICLAVDAGLRWMCLKNVSVDLLFKYRWAQPNFNYTFSDQVTGTRYSFSLQPDFNLFSGQLGVNYHF